jgi:putative aldouronate transport system substrate-binding protein
MGILDPEAFTMKYSNFLDKLKAGQVLMSYASWQAGGINTSMEAAGRAGQGFEYVPVGMPYVAATLGEDNPVGWGADYPLAITKNATKPDRVIQFIDYLFGYEGGRLLYSGVEGRDWETVKGKVSITKARLDGQKSDTQFGDKEGFLYSILSGCGGSQIAPDGYPLDITLSDDAKSNPDNLTRVDKDFIAHYGAQYKYPGQVVHAMIKQGRVQTWTKNWVFPQMVGQPSDDTKRKISQIDEYMKNQLAKIILAQTENQYQAELQKAKDALKTMGYDAASAEIVALYNKAEQALSSFSPY